MSTTEGYDLLAEIGESVPTDIARAFWSAGLLPNHLAAPAVLQGTPYADLEIFTQPPSLAIAPGASAASLIGVLRQPMIIRASAIVGEIVNTLEVRLPLTVVDRVVDGVALQLLELDFRNISVANTAFSNAQNALAQAIVAYVAAVLAKPLRLPVTPALVPQIRFFPQRGHSGISLKVGANVDGRDGAPLAPTPSLLVPPTQFDPPRPQNLAGVIDGTLFLNQVRAELVKRKLVSGQILIDRLNNKLLDLEIGGEITIDPDLDIPFFPDGGFKLPIHIDFSPTLQTIRLTKDIGIQLGTHQIRVSGAIKAIIDNGPDVEADFDLRVGVGFSGGKLTAHIFKADIDVDTTIFQVMLVVLFGPLGLVLGDLLDKAIDTAVSNAVEGESFPVDLPKKTVFVDQVAITNDPAVDKPVTLRVEPHGALIRPDAIGALCILKPMAQAVPIPVPSYLIGNVSSKELHKPDCKFVGLMNVARQVRFVRAPEAVAQGYDGCRLCLSEFDGKGAPRLSVMFIRPAGFGQKRSAPITISGKRQSAAPGPLAQPFNLTGRLTSSNEDGYWVDFLDAGLVAPGAWSITVRDGDWSATKTVELNGNAGQQTQLVFRYGVDSPPLGAPIGGVRLTFVASKEQAAQKVISPLYFGEYLGAADGTPATKKWTTSAGGPITSGHTAIHRDVPFLRPGLWRVTVNEHGKVETRQLEVKANELSKAVFHRV